MALTLAGISLAFSAVGLISSFLGSKKASKAAKKQAEIEAKQEGLLTDERLRQLGIAERVLYGETVAGAAGSGVLSSFGSIRDVPLTPIGSVGAVLEEQSKEFAFERKIVKEVGATKVQAGLAAGSATATAYKYKGYSDAFSGIGSILGQLAKMKKLPT